MRDMQRVRFVLHFISSIHLFEECYHYINGLRVDNVDIWLMERSRWAAAGYMESVRCACVVSNRPYSHQNRTELRTWVIFLR